jgi:hypothetical protein
MFCYEPETDKRFLLHIWEKWQTGIREMVVPSGENYEVTAEYRRCKRCNKIDIAEKT